MERLVRPGRVAAIFIVFALIIALYATSLYDLQVVQGSNYYALSTGTVTSNVSVSASRGAILDRNGTILVDSVPCYNVGILRNDLMSSEDPNGTLLKMAYFAIEHGASYTDTFPITISPPFDYVTMDATQEYRFGKYVEFMGLDPNISASDLIIWLKSHYGLDYTTNLKDARLIIGLRYELELRLIINISAYVFVPDASNEFIAAILEQNFPGININKASKRRYHTPYAAHVLGYIGLMNEEEYDHYKDLGYPMNAYVGKDGVEYAFEEYLHGTDGVTQITWNDNGEVIDERVITPATAGDNVYLSLDLDLQMVAEKSLATTIDAINATLAEEDEDAAKATGGSVVAVDCRRGAVLALASNPTYDPATFLENYNMLVNDPSRPMFNRATMGLYNPGSTFKPITALTGLRNGVIEPDTAITCTGYYTKYEDYGLILRCWVAPDNHGPLTVVDALGQSCNVFFFTVGNQLGPTSLAATAEEFGLGDKTGVEIPEYAGQRATIEYKAKVTIDEEYPEGRGWYDADTLMDAIGQSFNYYTTIQMANYVATIANGGTHYELSLLDFVTSSDYSNIVYTREPVVRNVVEQAHYLDVIHQGMMTSAKSGTGKKLFRDYKVDVATKTGTTQSDASTSNSGVFICFAPAEDPEIAIAVTVENGQSGASIMNVARDILDEYFSASYTASYLFENQLLP